MLKRSCDLCFTSMCGLAVSHWKPERRCENALLTWATETDATARPSKWCPANHSSACPAFAILLPISRDWLRIMISGGTGCHPAVLDCTTSKDTCQRVSSPASRDIGRFTQHWFVHFANSYQWRAPPNIRPHVPSDHGHGSARLWRRLGSAGRGYRADRPADLRAGE
jgi:hypothetical protein